MKRTIPFLMLILSACAVLHAQAPQAITLQAVLRDAAGRLVDNRTVGVRVSISQGSAMGTVVYREIHTAATNQNGLYTLLIGQGNPSTGTFANIDWGRGPYYLTIEADPAGGSNYVLPVVQPLVSVPYALFADSAARVSQAALRIMMDSLMGQGGATATSVPRYYIDSVVNANMATKINETRNEMLDSMYQIRVVLWNYMVSVMHDTATGGTPTVPMPDGLCYVSCSKFDSLQRANAEIIRRLDSVVSRLGHTIDSLAGANHCVGRATMGSEMQSACISYTWRTNGQTYYASTTVTYLLPGANAAGCDSTVVLNLVINSPTHNVENQVSAGSYSWHGNTYTVSGTYTYDYTNAAGCASTDTLHLTVDGPTHNVVVQSACDAYTWHGATYTATGTYTYDYTNAAGRASTDTLHLTVNASSHSTETQASCDVYTWNGSTYTASGVYTHNYTNSAGCASHDTLHLTINASTHNAETQSDPDSYTWNGTAYTSSGDYTYSYTNDAGCASVDTLHLTIGIEGALTGTFTINANHDRVVFSQGNLQYQASTNTWRFAEHQYDYIGDERGNITIELNRPTQSAWIDLFGFGTSGWNSGDNAYQPYSISTDNNDYIYTNLIGDNVNADWGVYNAISNGGNVSGLWRTLSSEEMDYILNKRETNNIIMASYHVRKTIANINIDSDLVSGVILFPDGYSGGTPRGVTWGSDITKVRYNETTECTTEGWRSLEKKGCVFLPYSGVRIGNEVDQVNECGYYWTSTRGTYYYWGYFLSYGRYAGRSVRLVQNSGCRGINTSCAVHRTAFGNYLWHDSVYTTGGTYTYDYIDPIGCPASDTLHLTISDKVGITGALIGEFSVDANGKKVRFSQGNLQYQASTDTWRFADHQFDYIGNAIGNTTNPVSERSYQSAWIDLFGWGTSGWRCNNKAYHPYDIESYDYNYGPRNGNVFYSLIGDYKRADWGVYNSIINGGNEEGLWRTLTSDEWNYLLFTREGSIVGSFSNVRFTSAIINMDGNPVRGLIIFPDNYVGGRPTGVIWGTFNCQSHWTTSCTKAGWMALENAGCVFLPAAGFRDGVDIGPSDRPGSYEPNPMGCGAYWSSSLERTGYGYVQDGEFYGAAYALSFFCAFLANGNSSVNCSITSYQFFRGCSVRLVQDL